LINQQQLIAGIKQLDITVNDQAIGRLLAFSEQVSHWNKTHNLTAIKSSHDFLTKNLLDSLALLPVLQSSQPSQQKQIHMLDIGSGAGFPGLVLSLVDSSIQLTSVDSSHKRIAFQKHIIREFSLAQVRALHSRIEALSGEQFTQITCRAFASITDIVSKSHHLLAQQGKWILLKGVEPSDEIKAFERDPLADQYAVTAVKKIKVPLLDAQRHVVQIEAIT